MLCTVKMPSPANPKQARIAYITIMYPDTLDWTMMVPTTWAARLTASKINRLGVTGLRSIKVPMGMLKRRMGKKVKKYMRLNWRVEKQ